MDSNLSVDPFGDEQKRQRNQRILEMRREGISLREIGNAVGVSHETVAFVCRKNGLGRVVLAQTRALSPEKRESIITAWVNGDTIRNIAEREGIYIASAKRVVEEDASARQREARRILVNRRRGNFGQRISDQQIVLAVRQCGDELGKRPTTQEYRKWAAETGNPSGALVQKRMGWKNAIVAAGFEPIDKRGRGPRWSDEDCWNAGREAARILGHAPSIGEYEETIGYLPDYPGAQTVRQRCGGWTNLTQVIHEELLAAGETTKTPEAPSVNGDFTSQTQDVALAVGKPAEKKKWWSR